jgi:hypothetical protein
MVKRLLRRQLVDTLHTKISERLFSLLKSSLRNERCRDEGLVAQWLLVLGQRDGSLPVRQRRIVSEARGRLW